MRVMASEFDASEFVDHDVQAARKASGGGALPSPAGLPGRVQPAPTRQEVDSKVTLMQQKLSELKRVQQELERERGSLEEIRRRQSEFTTGRQEMLQHLTRGVGLLTEAEFAARRDAEQMAKTLAGFHEALQKIQSLNEATWTQANLNVELARASTAIENARMEWNAARLKFSILSGAVASEKGAPAANENSLEQLMRQNNFAALCKLGLSLSWPLALVVLAMFVVLLALLLRVK